MKKSLIAVAVAAALPAFAQAQSNVQLYGIMDVGVGFKDQGGSSDSAVVVDSGYQSTSRLGVRGSENLGGGLTAQFNLEMGIGADQGTAPDTISLNNTTSGSNGLFQRRSVVGLKSSWGEVNFGRDYTPGFSSAGSTDIMGYSFFGNWLNFTAGATQGTTGSGLGIQTRASNGIHYKSPAFGNTKCLTAPMSTECNVFGGGFSFSAMYATGEQINGQNAGDAYGAAGVYKGGPLTLQGYWQRSIAQSPLTTVPTDVDVDQYGIGGGWNFGMFRIAANWGEAKYSAGAIDAKNSAWGLGGAMKLGPGELLINYIDRKLTGLNAQLGLSGDPKASTWGIAYTYPMSKRTNLYATFGQTNNNSNGAFALVYSQSSYRPAELGADVTGFAVGVRHLF